ncbi:MAG: phosphatidylglycerol lysyltransferase domain-containing protein, partial [Tateyamaria sp.]
VGQTVGFGLLTGALARWRMLPDLPVTRALYLSAFVSVSFVLAWICVTGLICLVLPSPRWTWALTTAACITLVAGAALLFFKPAISLGQRRIALPSLPIAAGILWFSFLDMILAAVALWVFFPAGGMTYLSLLPLFLIALGCGLMSNTPGGVGPFELVFVTATPAAMAPDVLAAIVAFRLVYYAVPALCAALAMLRPPAIDEQPSERFVALAPKRSEARVLAQTGGGVRALGAVAAPVWPTAQTRTLFTDQATGAATATLRALRDHARASGHVPLLYKSGKRLAHAARSARWVVLHIADDAVVPTAGYDVEAPRCRRLRRKLRAAAKAGIMTRPGHMPTMAEAQRVDAEWRAWRGTARGGSMGRLDSKYVQEQWVGSAYLNQKLVAFVTFHRGVDDWCLDIMRQGADTPDGTMHLLVHEGVTAARAAGAQSVSLAATVACPDPGSAFWRWAAGKAVLACGGAGLRQFKSAFAPIWVPRYAAAPTRLGLALGLADIAKHVWYPPETPVTGANKAHHNDENNELASYPQSCEWSEPHARKAS